MIRAYDPTKHCHKAPLRQEVLVRDTGRCTSRFKRWYLHGQLHRTDGPAVTRTDGSQEWYLNDQLHRTDGPAVIRSDGSQQWYIRGQDITTEVEAWMQSWEVTWPWDESTRVEFALSWS